MISIACFGKAAQNIPTIFLPKYKLKKYFWASLKLDRTTSL
jgi:hypothetical protein